MVFATVPAAPPTAKNHRATSWPPPISANVPYFVGSRLSATAFCRVLEAASSMMERPENRRPHPATPSQRLSTQPDRLVERDQVEREVASSASLNDDPGSRIGGDEHAASVGAGRLFR